MSTLTRRSFLVSTAILGLSLSRTCRSGYTRELLSQNIERKDIRDLSPDELTKYREALNRLKMKGPQRPTWANGTISLPDVTTLDKTGYAYQALIHTSNCPHRNWWFLPWHRAYLFTFEQLLRASVADFMPAVPIAVPYWNWTEQLTIPQEFTENPGTNSLYDDRRFSVPLTDEDVGPGTIQRTVDQASTFSQFGSFPACAKREAAGEGPFEQGPHDTVHGSVGGAGDSADPSTWGTMTTTLTSAFDPIFWSHHANIDRLWNVWRDQPGHLNPGYDELCLPLGSDVTWGNLVFDEFVDPQGAQMSRTVRDFLEDPLVKSVSYKKFVINGLLLAQNTGKPAQEFIRLAIDKVTNAKLQLELGKPITLRIPITPDARVRLEGLRRQPARPVLFQLEGVKRPVGFTGVRVRAFLNNPKADATTSYKDSSYAGYFTFFDASHPQNHEESPHVPPYTFNLGPVIQRLGDKVRFDKPLTVTLVMVPKDAGKQTQIGRVRAIGTAGFQGGKLLIGK